MKILQINKLYYPVIGGIETIVQNIAEKLNQKSEFTVDVLVCQNKGKRQIETVRGVKVYRAASWGKKLGMPLSLDFFQLFKDIKNNYDQIILHYPFPLAALTSPFIPKKKLIIYYHSDIVRQKLGALIFSPFIKYSLKKAHTILVGSHNLINSSPNLKTHSDKCQVLPFGYQADYTPNDYQKAEEVKRQYGKNKILLLAVGRLVYYKGFAYAIKAMSGVKAQLLIIGDGPEKGRLEKLITDLNLQKNVSIISCQPDLKPFFLAADIFLFPSTERSEAFGLVQLEALAAGKPIINTYLQTGVEEVSLNEVTGLTVKPRNIAALNKAINTLVSAPKLRKKFGQAGQERYHRLYTTEIFIDNLKTILNNI